MILLAYFFFVFILAALALVVIISFLRYRFKGDKSLLFVAGFTLFFILTLIFNLSILLPAISPI